MYLQVLDFFEVGKSAHFTLNPSSYINMHGGYREFSVEARYNAIKRFFAKKGMRMLWEKLLTKFFLYTIIINNNKPFLGLGG
jgi:hypothetical protein